MSYQSDIMQDHFRYMDKRESESCGLMYDRNRDMLFDSLEEYFEREPVQLEMDRLGLNETEYKEMWIK